MRNPVFVVLLRVFAAAMLALGASVAHAQGSLDGTYRGLDGATGITIRLSPGGDGYYGEIVASSGGRAEIVAQAYESGARGPLTLQGRPGVVELIPQPLGLSMIWRADGGTDELIYAFRHEQIALPSAPSGYVDPPPPGATRVNPIDFLNSYEFWEAVQVGRAYDGLEDKYRVIMKTFPVVHTDILWKLCRAPVAPDQLADALRGQGVTCDDVDGRLKSSQANGSFSRFKQRVGAQKVDALLAVECARGINTAPVCSMAAQRTQQAALSLETVGSVLQNF